MKFYINREKDGELAVYELEGKCYPVFAEKYGDAEVTDLTGFTEVTNAKEVEALKKYLNPYGEGLRIYMAGPLFNEGDRYVNQCNSDVLRAEGYTTFLPQEVVIDKDSTNLVKAACFYMDFKAIRMADVILANCNGIEIDSGTAAEIGLSYGLGKKIFLYKSDVRNYYNDQFRLNNFVGGLVNNVVYSKIEDIVEEIRNM